ncbi:MAG: NAD(P)H-dependent oxidoreductase subunit E [Corynebacterium sp.]|nr:NAD(P)H-dependent oxidoreductase subunit E [Corynebacterium sp.]
MIEQEFHNHFGDEDRIDMTDTETNITEETIAEMKELAARYPHPQSAMLPMLHLVQSVDGRVSAEGVRHISRILDLPEAKVIGIATFYTQFHADRVGTHLVGVCTTSLCAVMGGDMIYETLEKKLQPDRHGTSADGAFTLERVECNAACDFAPVMMLNWEFMDNMTPKKAVEIVDDLRAGKTVHSTRGPAITSWRDNERVLAGFYDGKANDGPAAGPASLAGLNYAREHGIADADDGEVHATESASTESTEGSHNS